MDDTKRRSIITLILLVIVLIVICLVAYFLFNSNRVTKELEDAKNTISSNITKINELTDQIKKNDELAAELAKKEIGKFVPFDGKKCLNSEEGMKYTLGTILNEFANITIKDGKVYVEFTDKFEEQFLNESNPLNLVTSNQYEIKGFSKNVVDVNIYSVGHSIGQTVMLFLMEDGTIEASPLARIRLDGVKTFGKIKGVEKVVRIINGAVSGDISGYVSPFAITENGGFYSLASLLNEQGFYE